MATRTIYFNECAAVSVSKPNNHYTPGSTHSYSQEFSDLLIKTNSFIDDIQFRELYNFFIVVYVNELEYESSNNIIRPFMSEFDENLVTYKTKPEIYYPGSLLISFDETTGYKHSSPSTDPIALNNFVKHGAYLAITGVLISTPYSENRPYILIAYGDRDIGLNVTPTFPTETALISRHFDTVFSWSISPEIDYQNTIGGTEIVPVQTKFRWRYKGETSYTEIDVGSDINCTIPAGTFLPGTIEWQVSLTSNSNVTTNTSWTAVGIAEPIPSTVIVSPKNAALDGTAEIKFEWSHVISNGSPQAKYDLQTSLDNATWSTIREEITSETFTVFAPNTFSGGDLYWRVRTYNSDEISGEWSESAHCIIIAAPTAPSVAITRNAPQFSIAWQQTGQQGYEIKIDDTVVLKKFGLNANYLHDDYLKNGTHRVQVRIQNKYGLWSEWGFVDMKIENEPGLSINLFAELTDSVQLNWDTSGAYSDYWIYRSGQKIGESKTGTFIDHFAAGFETYQVRGISKDSGNYTLSNAIEVNVSVKKMMIASVNEPNWLDISRSISSLRDVSESISRFVTFNNYAGNRLPIPEVGEYVSKTFKFDAAWPTIEQDSICAFESLLGKLVCIKSPYGRKIVGVLTPIDRRENRLITKFSASITLVDWKEWEA